ncbi:MAG: DUF4367 domain-containing protein [Clostridia bacterium]|nr:DUF4367 domain-containing protein [Clostridia bacterium]
MNITEEMLYLRAEQAMEIWERSLPEDRETHLFSKRFLRKMKRLLYKKRNPWMFYVVRLAAVLVLCLGVGTAALQLQSRYLIRQWDNMESTAIPVDFEFSEPAYIPEGYTLQRKGTDYANSSLYICYQSDDGGILSYMAEYCGRELVEEDAAAFLTGGDLQIIPLSERVTGPIWRKTVSVNGQKAVLEYCNNGWLELYWTGEAEKYCISGRLTEVEMLRMAESVQPGKL